MRERVLLRGKDEGELMKRKCRRMEEWKVAPGRCLMHGLGEECRGRRMDYWVVSGLFAFKALLMNESFKLIRL